MRTFRQPDFFPIKPETLTPKHRRSSIHLKSASTPTLHSTSVRAKISELAGQKKKVMKCIKLLQLKFKESQQREEYLNCLSSSIENRILNIEKRKNLLQYRKGNATGKDRKISVNNLVGFTVKLQELYLKEKELDELEYEINLKAEDFSFETRSSEGPQGVSFSKDSAQKIFLRNSLTKIETKGESYSRNTNIKKFQKETILQQKIENDDAIKRFSLVQEIFSRKEAAFNIFKQQVFRKKQIMDQQKSEIKEEYASLDKIYKENDAFLSELKQLKKDLEVKRRRTNVDAYSAKVVGKEEEVMILRENAHKHISHTKAYRLKIKKLEQELRKKYACIECKQELLELIKKIEFEITNMRENPDQSSDTIYSFNEKKNYIKAMVEEAISKEREISSIERTY